MSPLSRREFVRTGALSAAALALRQPAAAAPISANTSTTREPLRELPYTDVQLTGGPFADHYNAIHAHYLSLSDDRLLKVYRQRAGLPAPGDDMGGWYDLNGFVPGHSLGQYISGLARLSASTGDTSARDKVHALVAGFAETLGPQNQSILRPDTNLWTCYILDKHFVGLIDAATLTGDSSATALLSRVLAGAEPLLPAEGRDRIGKKNPPYDETYVMPENLFLAARLTGNPRFHQLAQRYLLNRELFDPLARGDDPFPGQHAYSHAIALSSGARAWLELGDARYRDAIRHAFTLLTTTQQFASGGWGPNETFITPHRGELYDSLSTTVDHFETPCGSFAATKLARYLLRTGVPTDTAAADNLERVLYNTILVVRPPASDGDYPYYSTYSPAAKKVFYPSKWPCCSGTLVQTVADYPLNLYLAAEDGLYVVGYTPSRARFVHRGTEITLTQESELPTGDTVRLTLHPARPTAFAIYLRLPGWLARPATIRLNGRAVPAEQQQGGSRGEFVRISGAWRAGDRLELTLPQDFRTEPIDDKHPETVALMRGPVQYVAIEPAAVIHSPRRVAPANLRQVAPEVYTENDIVFVPLRAIANQTYTAYFTKA